MNAVHSASYAMGIVVSLLGVEQPGCEDSFPSSTDMKNDGNYTLAPPICLHGMNRDKFTLQKTVTMESVLTGIGVVEFLVSLYVYGNVQDNHSLMTGNATNDQTFNTVSRFTG